MSDRSQYLELLHAWSYNLESSRRIIIILEPLASSLRIIIILEPLASSRSLVRPRQVVAMIILDSIANPLRTILVVSLLVAVFLTTILLIFLPHPLRNMRKNAQNIIITDYYFINTPLQLYAPDV